MHPAIEDKALNNDYKSAIKWWEKKRLIYNLIAISGGLMVIILRSGVPNGISSLTDFGIIFFWLFGANIFYTVGWSLEFLLNYYFKTKLWSNKTRNVFFVLGSVFSFFWMFLLTREIQ